MDKKYLKVAEYNRMYILNEVLKLLEEEGARVLTSKYNKPTKIYLQTYFVGHGFTEVSQEAKDKLDKCYKYGFQSRINYLHIDFIYQGYYYSLSLDDNVFFEGTLLKVKVDDKLTYLNHRYCTALESLDDHNKGKYKGYAVASCGLGDNCFNAYTKDQLKKKAKEFYNSYFKEIVIGAKENTRTYKKPMQHTNVVDLRTAHYIEA